MMKRQYNNILSWRSVWMILAGLVFAAAWCSLSANSVSAEQAKGLTVSPLRTEVEVAPGTSQDKTLSVTNNNDTPITVYLSAEEFSVINEQYDYAFNIETELIKWIIFTSPTVELAPGETKSVRFRVGVPINAEPGGRYISLFASTDAEGVDGGSVSIQRIASLVYINVSGEVSRQGNLLSLRTPWFMHRTTTWTAQVQNVGSTHFRTDYTVTLQSLIGDTTIATKTGNALILPGTIRAINNSLPLPALPGIYKVIYKIGLGDTPAYKDTRIVIYFPPAAIITTIFALILGLSLVSEFHRRKKNKN